MKKAISVLTCLLFVLTILYPAGVIITACLGYRFELISVSAFAIAIAVLSLCISALDILFKITVESRATGVLFAIITPISLINALMCIAADTQALVIASLLFSAICCCFLTIRLGRPSALKAVALALSAAMLLPIYFLGFIALTLGNFSENTVVQTIESPNGEYYAQVIDSAQGALGGNTFVDVRKTVIDGLFFKIEKEPKRIYSGHWGEFKKMQIHWENDGCLVINSHKYEIE